MVPYLCPLSDSSPSISDKDVFLLPQRGPALFPPEDDGEGVQVGAVVRLSAGGDSEVLQDKHHHWVVGLSPAVRPQPQTVEKVSQELEISLFEDRLQGEVPGATGPGRFVTQSALPVRRFGGEEQSNLCLVPSHGLAWLIFDIES